MSLAFQAATLATELVCGPPAEIRIEIAALLDLAAMRVARPRV